MYLRSFVIVYFSLGAATDAVSAICDLQPLTDYTLQFRRTELRSVVGIMGMSVDSGSTPTPSANMDPCSLQQQQLSQQQQNSESNRAGETESDQNKRSIGDGPTTRQKILVASIWIFSAIFALATCFPDKIFGVSLEEISAPPPRNIFFRPTNSQVSIEQHVKELDLSYCYVKTNVNMMDYVALAVAFLLPLLLGPCITAVFQVNYSFFFEQSLKNLFFQRFFKCWTTVV